jgi:hypothetical protein
LPRLLAKMTEAEGDEFLASLLEEERLRSFERSAKGLTDSLKTFCRASWPIIEPETKQVWSWVDDYLCEWLTLVSSGEFKRRHPEKLGLLINVPPRTGKSIKLTVRDVI